MRKIRFVINRKGLLAENTRINVKAGKKYKPKTPLGMFARSKVICDAGYPIKTVTINKLSEMGKDVVKGVLVDNQIRGFNQFDYTRAGNTYGYSTKLTPVRFPLDTIKAVSEMMADLNDPAVAVDIIRKAVLSRYSRKQLYSMYQKHLQDTEQAKSDWEFAKRNNLPTEELYKKMTKKFELRLNCSAVVVGGEDDDGVINNNLLLEMPSIRIKKVFRNEEKRKVPDYDEKIKNIERTVQKSVPIPMDVQGVATINGKDYKIEPGTSLITVKEKFVTEHELYVDDVTYDFFIDKNTINIVRENIALVQDIINNRVNFS